MPIWTELDQLENCHNALAELKPLGAWREGARTTAPEIVDEIVAVGRYLQLAQPPEGSSPVGIDGNRPKPHRVWVG